MDTATDDVSFELDRFGWAAEDRLEVAGRWIGVRRRLARPTLVVVVDGRRRRLRTLPGAWSASADGWEAAFAWQGGPVELDGAELEVGRSIVVDLPRPRRLRRSEPVESAEVHEERDVPSEPKPAKQARESKEIKALSSELEAARAEAAEARAALEREQEELAIARRALSAARDGEEDERKEAQSARSELEQLRGELETLRGEQETLRGEHETLRDEHERQTEELAGARSELAGAEERVAAAVASGREEAQQLREELARARTSPELPQPQTEAAAPAGRFAPTGSEDRTRSDGTDLDDAPAQPRARRLDSALSDDRPREQRFEPARQEERLPAAVANRATSVTERAAAWASGAAERARRVVASDAPPDNGKAAPSPARVRSHPQRVRVRSPQRVAELESQPEPSWALRAVAVGLVTVLLVALALIVSFLT